MNFERAISVVGRENMAEDVMKKFIFKARERIETITQDKRMSEEEKEEEIVAYQLFIDDIKNKLRFKQLTEIILTSE